MNADNQLRKGMEVRRGRWAPEYKAYRNMLDRVFVKTRHDWSRYGGRGIKICDRWLGEHGYRNFLADMGRRPSANHSLDRINNDGDYAPSNCRWATREQQMRNRSITKLCVDEVAEIRRLSEQGETYSSIARTYGVHKSLVRKIVLRKIWR